MFVHCNLTFSSVYLFHHFLFCLRNKNKWFCVFRGQMRSVTGVGGNGGFVQIVFEEIFQLVVEHGWTAGVECSFSHSSEVTLEHG